MPDTKPQPDLRIAEAAEQLNTCISHIYNLINDGRLTTYNLGRARRITRESFEQLRRGEVSA